MNGHSLGDAAERRVKALQLGSAVGLLVLIVVAERSTAPSVQWPVLVLVLVSALLVERRQRGARQRAAGQPAAGATPQGALRHGRMQRLWLWVQTQISEGVVHGHEEGERCNDLCRRTRAPGTSGAGHAGRPTPESASARGQGLPEQRGVAGTRSPRSTTTRGSA